MFPPVELNIFHHVLVLCRLLAHPDAPSPVGITAPTWLVRKPHPSSNVRLNEAANL